MRNVQVGKVWIILRHEIAVQIGRVSFWIGVLLPLVGYLVYGGATLLNHREGETGTEMENQNFTPQNLFQRHEEEKPLGYVDLAGVVQAIPDTLEPGAVISFESEMQAHTAIQTDEIRGYYVIDNNFMDGAPLLYYTDEFYLTNLIFVDSTFKQVLVFNMLDGNQALFRQVLTPVASVDETILVPENASTFKSENTYSLLVPIYMVMFFMTGILGESSLMLNSFNREAETRVMEILLSSANTREIMWGKFVAYWLIGLVSILFWMANLAVFSWLTGDSLASFEGIESINFSGGLIFGATIFGLLGFFFYSTLMMGLGTLVPYLREMSRIMQFLLIPVITPTLFATIFAEDPNGILPVVLSFFPLTAPTAVMIRLMFSNVPGWQILLSGMVMIASTILAINLIARHYKPHHLLSDAEGKLLANLKSLLKRLSFQRRAKASSPAD